MEQEHKPARKGRSKSTDEPLISVKDLEDNPWAPNSPRTLEACKREGIEPGELVHRPYEEFASKVLPEELAKMRYDYYENKRQELIKIIKKARRKIIKEEKGEGEHLHEHSAQESHR